MVFFFFLVWAARGHPCFTWAFSSCRERGRSLVSARGLLIAVAPLAAERGL